MTDEQLDLLVTSYGLCYLLECCDVEPVYVLKLLIEQGEIEDGVLEEIFE